MEFCVCFTFFLILLTWKNATDFCQSCILLPCWTCVSVLVADVWILWYPMYSIMSSPYHENHTSLLPSGDLLFLFLLWLFIVGLLLFFFFFLLEAIGRTSNPMLNRRDGSGHPWLVSDFSGSTISLSPLRITVGCMLVVSGLYYIEICSPYLPWAEFLWWMWLLNFIKCFSASMKWFMCCFFSFLCCCSGSLICCSPILLNPWGESNFTLVFHLSYKRLLVSFC